MHVKMHLMKDYANEFTIKSYSEHSCGDKSSAKAIAYIEIMTEDKPSCFGVGSDNNITIASIKALFCSFKQSI